MHKYFDAVLVATLFFNALVSVGYLFQATNLINRWTDWSPIIRHASCISKDVISYVVWAYKFEVSPLWHSHNGLRSFDTNWCICPCFLLTIVRYNYLYLYMYINTYFCIPSYLFMYFYIYFLVLIYIFLAK